MNGIKSSLETKEKTKRTALMPGLNGATKKFKNQSRCPSVDKSHPASPLYSRMPRTSTYDANTIRDNDLAAGLLSSVQHEMAERLQVLFSTTARFSSEDYLGPKEREERFDDDWLIVNPNDKEVQQVTETVIEPPRDFWQDILSVRPPTPPGPPPMFDELPMEVLVMILEYLNATDIANVSLVCQRLLDATRYFRLVEKRVLKLHKINFCESEEPISNLYESKRYFPNITLYVCRFNDSDYFWRRFGAYVKHLEMKMCIIKKDKLLSILRHLPNLESLTIYDCNELMRTWKVGESDPGRFQLPKLKRLNLRKLNNFHRAVLTFLLEMTPNLDSLEVSDCFKECIDSVSRVRIIDHVIECIRQLGIRLKLLNIAGTPIDDMGILQLAEIETLRLCSMSLTFSGKITNPGLMDLLKIQTSITELDFSGSINLLDYCLVVICSKMPNIRVLKLRKCMNISDIGIREVMHLHKLQVLDISGCERITDVGFITGVVGKRWTQFKNDLKEIYMGSNANYTEFPLARCAELFHKITVLDLSGSSNCVTDYTIQCVIHYLKNLRELNLDSCGNLSDAGLTGYCLEDARWSHRFPEMISSLKGLQVLKISGCYQISDSSLREFRFLDLKELSLSRCQMITQYGLEYMAENCPSIEILDLTECQNVTDTCVDILTRHLKRLTTLRLVCCNQLTDKTLHSIAANCTSIRTLNLRGCFEIASDPKKILAGISSLKNISGN